MYSVPTAARDADWSHALFLRSPVTARARSHAHNETREPAPETTPRADQSKRRSMWSITLSRDVLVGWISPKC